MVIEPRGYREGLDRYTYWTAPLYYPLQAAWYRVFGFSLLSMRSLSTMFGLLLVLSVFIISRKLFMDDSIAILTAALLSFDYVVVMGSSFGRMDIICSAFGWSAIAAYFLLRERNLFLALLVGQTLVVLSGLTHFLGVLYFLALWIVAAYFDRSRLSARDVVLSFIPYLIGGLAWGAYILQEPALFMSQFGGNAADGGRLKLLADPISAIYKELTLRYAVAYGLGPNSLGSTGPIWLKSSVLVLYLVSLITVLAFKELRRHSGVRICLVLLSVFFVVLTILDGQKLSYYLLNIIPLYSIITAVSAVHLYRASRTLKIIVPMMIAGVLFLQLGGLLYKMRSNAYADQFAAAATFLSARSKAGDVTAASAEMAFALGFDGQVVDDHWLGFERNRRFRFFVLEEVYLDALDGKRQQMPEVYHHVVDTLNRDYELVYDQAHYKIYQLKARAE
ncbi:MAG: glycosyltransferase family 39 protein [Acidobacteria bacterium]|nr:glycosyltransferase family 39 protein [Acidobacteriota bacterium]